MYDIQFDVVTREIVMKDNDFLTTSNPSIQNGGILLYSRCCHLSHPMAGIGVEEVMGSDLTKTTFEMNRWQQMVKDDSATKVGWKAVPNVGNEIIIEVEVSYV